MKPVVLLIPGILCDASLWDEVAADLAGPVPTQAQAQAQLQVLIVDITGQDSIQAMADRCWQRVADLPEGTPLVLAGFSLGGYVAIEMLARPQRALAAAALVSTSARPETPESGARRAQAMQALRDDFTGAVEDTLRWTCADPSPELADRLRRMMHRVGAATALRQNKAIAGRADHREALARLALPVQVLCGEADRITPPRLSQELAALIPGARLQRVEAAGHMLPSEQPRALAAALRALGTPFLHPTENDRRQNP